MENKINVAELLKDCPKGMELDCVLFNNPVRYDGLDNDYNYPIIILTENDDCLFLTTEGYLYNMPNSKCVIFPKGKTTWEGFVPPCQFEDGDILVHTQNQRFIMSIYHKRLTELIIKTHCILWDKDEGLSINMDICCYPDNTRPATEEEKQKLFQAIKDNGYRWNAETKTLEKLIESKFKVGDRIKYKREKFRDERTITSCGENGYWASINDWIDYDWIDYENQDEWELVPNKFDITTLKPFKSKVLVRAVDNQFWRPAIYGIKQKGWDFYCVVGGEMWEQCIPYEGNEHLLGTTDNCDEYYKTWE